MSREESIIVRCDWCPERFEIEDEDELNEAMLDAGWYQLREGTQLYDFCCSGCLIAHVS